MGWFDSITSFVTDNSSWLKPVASIGMGALQQSQKDDTQQQYLDYLRQQEDQNYQDSVTGINAYNEQLKLSQANSAARAAAARQTEANRMKASKKANKVSQQSYKDILAMFKPYKDVADRLLPQKTQAYENSLGLQKSLLDYIQQPNQKAKLDAAGPAWNVNVPLPDSIRLK